MRGRDLFSEENCRDMDERAERMKERSLERAAFNAEATANQNLAALGLTKRHLHGYRYEYLRGDEVVHVGNVYTVSEWMAAGCPAASEVTS